MDAAGSPCRLAARPGAHGNELLCGERHDGAVARLGRQLGCATDQAAPSCARAPVTRRGEHDGLAPQWRRTWSARCGRTEAHEATRSPGSRQPGGALGSRSRRRKHATEIRERAGRRQRTPRARRRRRSRRRPSSREPGAPHRFSRRGSTGTPHASWNQATPTRSPTCNRSRRRHTRRRRRRPGGRERSAAPGGRITFRDVRSVATAPARARTRT
jgi:hypothetical protein